MSKHVLCVETAQWRARVLLKHITKVCTFNTSRVDLTHVDFVLTHTRVVLT